MKKYISLGNCKSRKWSWLQEGLDWGSTCCHEELLGCMFLGCQWRPQAAAVSPHCADHLRCCTNNIPGLVPSTGPVTVARDIGLSWLECPFHVASPLAPEVSTYSAEDKALIDGSGEWFPPEVNQGSYLEGQWMLGGKIIIVSVINNNKKNFKNGCILMVCKAFSGVASCLTWKKHQGGEIKKWLRTWILELECMGSVSSHIRFWQII